jgi:hypothetical protein
MDPTTLYVLRIADACLIHGQRLAQWCGHAPVLEEDIALTNVALDHIGQARSLLTLAGTLEGRGRDEDSLAFLRAERDYRNPTLLELPNATSRAPVAQLCGQLDEGAVHGADFVDNAQLAAIAAKSLEECATTSSTAATGECAGRRSESTAHGRGDTFGSYTAEWFADEVWMRRQRHRPAEFTAGGAPRRTRCWPRRACCRETSPLTGKRGGSSTWVSCWRISRCRAHFPGQCGEPRRSLVNPAGGT